MWRSSDVVIVHLNRISVDQNDNRSHIPALVDVPLGVVDFAPYFASNSPFRRQNNRYRLYAVLNRTHVSGGKGYCHAHCRPNDSEQWLAFADCRVSIDPAPIITQDARLLFFRRVHGAPQTLESFRSHFFLAAVEARAQQQALSSARRLLGIQPLQLAACNCLLYEIQAGVARSTGIFSVPSRDHHGRLLLAKCAITAQLSLRLLTLFRGQCARGDLLRFSCCILRRGYLHVLVRKTLETWLSLCNS